MNRLNRLMTFAGMAGFIEQMTTWDDILLSSKTRKLMQETENNILDLMKAYRLTEKETEQMQKKIDNVRFGCFCKSDIEKKLRTRKICMTQDTLDTIVEHAMDSSCIDCKRNISVCALRKAFKKAEIENFDEAGKCEYMVRGGK